VQSGAAVTCVHVRFVVDALALPYVAAGVVPTGLVLALGRGSCSHPLEGFQGTNWMVAEKAVLDLDSETEPSLGHAIDSRSDTTAPAVDSVQSYEDTKYHVQKVRIHLPLEVVLTRTRSR
jgi:hypothetical protein